MATIKMCTDIPQSKVLAKILPHESADMYYQYVLPKSGKIMHNPKIGNPINALEWYNKGYTASGKEPITLEEYCVTCWSLAALLSVLPEGIKYYAPNLQKEDGKYSIAYGDDELLCISDNPVDACYKFILTLHEEKML